MEGEHAVRQGNAPLILEAIGRADVAEALVAEGTSVAELRRIPLRRRTGESERVDEQIAGVLLDG